MKKTILTTLTKTMNATLHLDPESKQRMHKLQGKVIDIELLPHHFCFSCTFDASGIQLMTENAEMADVTLRGTPLQMLGMMIDKKNRQQFFADDLVMEGNAELGQQIVDLFDHLQIDWEEYLSRLVGDVPAYHAGSLTRQFKHWLFDTGNEMREDISDYLHEEAKWLPSREALNDFFGEIDLMRMEVDRMEAKINILVSLIDSEEVP